MRDTKQSGAAELDEDGAAVLLHLALEAGDGVPLDQAQLTDQQRLGVVLQGAALLAHLEHGGWFLPAGWDDASLTGDGLLKTAAICRGRSGQLVQVLLLQLLQRLFRVDGAVAGRGEARRSARDLTGRWQQILVPSSPDRAVAAILDAAPFLWQEGFAEARRALVAEHRSNGSAHLWLAGPGSARHRFLSRAATRRRVEALLASLEARDLWEGWRPGLDPMELAEQGRWQQAAVAWRREPPVNTAQSRALARCLIALGRYSQALAVLKGQKHLEARLLRARAQLYLGELGAAQATVRRLEEVSLSPEQTVELAEVAIRLFGKRGQRQEIREWAARGLAEARGKLRLEALIVAAAGAWDCDDMEAMDRYLEQSREALEEPELAGRWHHVRGLRAAEAFDGPQAVHHIGAALAHDRRRLPRVQVGRLWNDLAFGRVIADDLAGAERAARHALRLLGESEDPGRTTLALFNLAEVLLRRGRCEGVEEALDLSTAENRRAGNLRGLMQDLELWVRLELAQGRAVAALARCKEALLRADRDGAPARRRVFETLAARAEGWLGRRQRAAACLERADGGRLDELEPEERPALLALAGQLDAAAAVAAGTRWEDLWKALAAGLHPSPDVWDELRSLEPFRAARLIFDVELTLPGVVPPRRLRQAMATLRRCGAEALAEKLEGRSSSPWRALERYAAQLSDARAVRDLLTSAGYDDVRLSWIRHAREEVLIAGAGGGQELSGTAASGGRLVLRAEHIDGVLRTFFSLIRRDFQPPANREGRHETPADRDIVGESPVLRQAVDRLDRLAVGDLPVLILGESGTGKELMARRAHRMSRRAEGPFRPVNSAALPQTLIESELFGHVKGSFTGADRDRKGVFESARSGTVLLDEIGDLPHEAQAKLLRVLQESEIQRVGESFARKVDVRVITATHRDLEQMVSQGEFRRDLFFRLKVATIGLPPLRGRGRDVLLLADHFLARHHGAGGLTESARSRLLAYKWPGNVRELKNVVDVAVAMAGDRDIQGEDLDLPEQTASAKGDYHQLVLQYRTDLITEALSQTGGNRAAAARRLGLTRQALSYLVRRLGLS